MTPCPKCGFENDRDAIECQRCGIIFEKYKMIQQRKAQQQAQKQKKEEAPPAPPETESFPVVPEPKPIPHLNCNACGSKKTMAPTRIYRFSGIVQFIGRLIVIPSICGVLFAFMFLTSAGANPFAVGIAGFIAAGSLISGLIGWLLIMKKKVFKCLSCGFILDRD